VQFEGKEEEEERGEETVKGKIEKEGAIGERE